MPGIAGIIGSAAPGMNKQHVTLMIDCMMHEPFYTSGTYVNNDLNLCAGWVCHKDSFADCMPLYNREKDIVLLFSGENFPDNALVDRLKRSGQEFDLSNASYLIHLYEEDEDGFFQHLNGWFSGLLVDLRKPHIILFNDRHGMQRIYYHQAKDAFLFSSEAKSLLKVRPNLRRIDMQSLGQLFTCNCVLQNRTLFSGVSVLPPGSAWIFPNTSNPKKTTYFEHSIWENQPILGKEVFYDRLKATFLEVLPRYFDSKDAIGISLTSGMDTRVIMSWSADLSGELPCYTFTGTYRDTLDCRIARKVADTCNQSHYAIRLGEGFLSDFPSLAEKTIYITDGCLDVCGSNEIYLNTFAREISPIRMTGKFGSEIIGNHSMFKNAASLDKRLFHPDFERHLNTSMTTFADIKNGHKLSFAVLKEIPWQRYGRLAIEMSQVTVRTPYMDNDLVKLMYQAPASVRPSEEIRLRLIEDGNPTLRKIMTDRGTAGSSNYFFSTCSQIFYYSLFKMEHVCLFQLPHYLKKLEHIFACVHPQRLVLGRYNYAHYPIWFRHELADYLRDILLDRKSKNRQYLNKAFLEKMLNGHINGDANFTDEINKILTAELIHRIFIEDM